MTMTIMGTTMSIIMGMTTSIIMGITMPTKCLIALELRPLEHIKKMNSKRYFRA